ncbi:ornithine cyclodeaminase [Agromyces luteolus]|uniref:Ornithine cyclodeaminase family protein n=1 Tax=Agromyces luteolus TaxID=88373 RepID=A0A7C9HSL0_9MICO|nr:ornithine cyclodeaminase family protein [Agromyces luteolus]MUN08509.1 ornithine cyclodeaminase family protein [Agromyces luteolus]GLK27043.1 ornithine cyclodeaminase [Agromyces luteolus]
MGGTLDSVGLVDGPAIAERVSMRSAIDAIGAVLRAGYDPDADPPRSVVEVGHGQLLLMPSELGGWVGQKLATVAPGNPARGLERIQALYVLIDAETLAPVAVLDGTELTNLRTPAVSAAVLDVVAAPDAASLVVFGTGPQGVRHVEAMRAIRPIDRVRFVGREPGKARDAVARVSRPGLDAAVGSAADVADADVVVCATTAREPLFDATLVADRAAVVAVGSHEPSARELPGDLLGRAHVIVESERVALAEAGDVILAIGEGHLSAGALIPFATLFGGEPVPSDRPRVVKTCGMGWQDLAVAPLALANGGSA